MRVLLTGGAGFIGMHVAQLLLARGDEVLGLDSLNDYYDPALKQARLAQLLPLPGFRFVQADVADHAALDALFAAERFTHVVHLAAQAGVRYSLQNPRAYVQSNLGGFGNVLEACHQHKVQHLVYASSSSVYGANREMPFSVAHNVDHPVSLYAASKKANELMAHSYSHLFDLPTTGPRYFTVYGPGAGRRPQPAAGRSGSPPTPTQTPCAAKWALSRARRWPRALPAGQTGTGRTRAIERSGGHHRPYLPD